MRVISGTAGRLKLVTPKGMEVRPTTDRIKETLFNIISPLIYDCSFLDLFAGSGGIGIEALSRGACEAVFVDNNRESERCIKENLEKTRLAANAELLFMDSVLSVSRLFSKKKTFDIIFMDPPYSMDLEKKVLFELDKYDILNEDGIIIVEAAADTSFDFLEATGFEIYREKLYGSNKHVFIKKAG